MKMHTDAELTEIMQTEFQRGFEACRVIAVKICRTPHVGVPLVHTPKTSTDCANEIARLRVPRFKPEEK